MRDATTLIQFVVALLMLFIFGNFSWRIVSDRFSVKRHRTALSLIIQLQDLQIDEKLKIKEFLHLTNQLRDPSPAALAMVQDRIEELS